MLFGSGDTLVLEVLIQQQAFGAVGGMKVINIPIVKETQCARNRGE